MKQTYDRLSVLAKIRPIVGNNSNERKVEEAMRSLYGLDPKKDSLIFCIRDGVRIPADFWQVDGYQHEDHKDPRAFIFYPTTKWEFRDDGELRHFSVGAILWRLEKQREKKEKRYCLFRRRAHPTGYYTIPAGHLEMGEDPRRAALREIYEETQLGILSVEPVYEGEIEEECRRGADYHFWCAYLCECTGEPQMSDEADVIGWYTHEDIINELKLTKPTGVLFHRHFNEMPKHVRER
jgi:ADP-ribose pyrophosphatase YjhB (NUDIX family)